MKKRILRKGAIVALALVLMFNTLGVSASTAGDEERIPDITVSNYEELVRAFTEQRSGSLIGVTGTIEISPKTEIGRSGKYFDIIRMDSEAQLIFTKGGTAQDISTVENICVPFLIFSIRAVMVGLSILLAGIPLLRAVLSLVTVREMVAIYTLLDLGS